MHRRARLSAPLQRAAGNLPAIPYFSSCPLGQANGQDDLTIRLLLLRLRLDARAADELEAVIHAVQEQPHSESWFSRSRASTCGLWRSSRSLFATAL